RVPLPRVLGGLLRLGLQGAAGRLVGDAQPRRQPHLPQLGPPATAPDFRRDPDRAGRLRDVMRPTLDDEKIRIRSCLSESEERVLADDVLDGLTRPFKELPPKHFYDARGSELFEQICELPEYYPTRSERSILESYSDLIADRTGATELVELGAGYATKTRTLLDALPVDRFIPVDVSEATVRECAR